MSCDACKRATDDGRTCRFCGETRPHQSAVEVARAIRELSVDPAALRASLASAESQVATLTAERDRLREERDAANAGQALWIKTAAEYNDKLRESEKYWRTVYGDARGMLDLAEANVSRERAAREQAESRLSEAAGLLQEVDFDNEAEQRCLMPDDEPCGFLAEYAPCWSHRRVSFLASLPANPPTKGKTK